MTRPDALHERVSRLEASLAIITLDGQYARAWDTSDATGWARLFTEDGVFERLDDHGRAGHRKQGRAELEKFCAQSQQGFGRLHMMHSHEITVDGQSAHARATFECRRIATGEFPRHGLISGYYETDYQHVDGAWLIKHRRELQVFFREESYLGIG